MHTHWVHCAVPPSPEFDRKIRRTKKYMRRLATQRNAEPLPDDLLSPEEFELIAGRPKKTRPETFLSAARSNQFVGIQRVLVLFVDFVDEQAGSEQAGTNREDIERMLFGENSNSMSGFYKEASYNKVDIKGEVFPRDGSWYRAPKPKSEYTHQNFGLKGYPNNAQKLVEDVLDIAADEIDFDKFDNDGDGVVDALVVIAAGPGAELTERNSDIWSHKGAITPRRSDNVTVQTYFIAPSEGKLGVMCHELGHLLFKWPDLYDTDYSSQGTGNWDLMGSGNWNDGGNTPAHPVAWCKIMAGWVNPTTILNRKDIISIDPYATHAQVYKLPIGNSESKEYFLLSNRHQTGFDEKIPGEGLLIEHIDETRLNNTDEGHYLVDVEQADGKRHLNFDDEDDQDDATPLGNRGDEADVYPTKNNAEFSATSVPNSAAYDGSNSHVAVTDIRRSVNKITAVVNVGGAAARTLYRNKKVMETYATYRTKSAWARIQTLGWRRIKYASPDSVTNMFSLCCNAQVGKNQVNVDADGEFIYKIYMT